MLLYRCVGICGVCVCVCVGEQMLIFFGCHSWVLCISILQEGTKDTWEGLGLRDLYGPVSMQNWLL